MSKVWSIDVKIYATAYIKADTEAEAMEIAKGLKDTELSFPNGSGGEDLEVSGQQFDSEDLPDVSLSPVMTCYGPDNETAPDCVHDPDDMEG